MDKDLVKFKNVLEYFIAHQNYVQSNSELAVGYEKYIKPRIINQDFNYTGQGYKGARIQEHIKDWEKIKNHKICINIQPNFGDYTSKKCYLNWKETGVNIFCQWIDNKEVNALAVGYAYWWHKPTEYKLLLKKTIEELGLFKENEYNQNLEDFYNSFVQEIYDYDNHKGNYYQELQKYYKKLEADKNMEKNKAYRNILSSNYNLILTGAPGTGKTYLAKQIAAQMILGKEYDENVASEKEKMEEQYDFVQFHPSYDYTDFMEGLRPTDKNGNISFCREDGIFMKFCRRALKAYNNATDKENPPKYVFVIDEINRGELSKIFGELFFCIDPGYRGEDGKVKTQYNNLWKEDKFGDSDFFFIPKNVYIIGTMNDIDRSVESMDFAMRRRFAFKEVKAEDNMEMLKANEALAPFYDKIEERINNLNLCILTIQGFTTAYQIGASYFLKMTNYLVDGKVEDQSWMNLWENHLYGLLFEYLRGLPNAEEDMKKLYRAYNMDDKYNM